MLLMLEFMMAILAVKLVIAVVIMRTRTVVEINKRTNEKSVVFSPSHPDHYVCRGIKSYAILLL